VVAEEPVSAGEFPDRGILWLRWNDETAQLIERKARPVLVFIADPDGTVAPFLREIFRRMPQDAKLRNLLHEFYPALFLEAGEIPEPLRLLGAGTGYHIGILSPSGLTPMVIFDLHRDPNQVVDEIVLVLERLMPVWQ
jgi:hypothetical protein